MKDVPLKVSRAHDTIYTQSDNYYAVRFPFNITVISIRKNQLRKLIFFILHERVRKSSSSFPNDVNDMWITIAVPRVKRRVKKLFKYQYNVLIPSKQQNKTKNNRQIVTKSMRGQAEWVKSPKKQSEGVCCLFLLIWHLKYSAML